MKLKNYILNILQKHDFTVLQSHQGFEDNLQLASSYKDYWETQNNLLGNPKPLVALIIVKGFKKLYVSINHYPLEPHQETTDSVFRFDVVDNDDNYYSCTNITDAINYIIEFY